MIDRLELVKNLVELMKKNQWTVSFAESCTGGLASSILTELSGVSEVFQGSVVSYSNKSKIDVLGVREKLIEERGAVSEQVAMEMALGVRERLKSDWSVSVTGVAGPTGGTKEKPVGTVCFGLVGPKIEKTERKKFSGDRKRVQEKSALRIFELLSESIKEENKQ